MSYKSHESNNIPGENINKDSIITNLFNSLTSKSTIPDEEPIDDNFNATKPKQYDKPSTEATKPSDK